MARWRTNKRSQIGPKLKVELLAETESAAVVTWPGADDTALHGVPTSVIVRVRRRALSNERSRSSCARWRTSSSGLTNRRGRSYDRAGNHSKRAGGAV